MPIERLKRYFEENQVHFTSITHPPAFTAQEIAAETHTKGKELAKTVMVKLDGAMAMAVLPASLQIDLYLLREATGAAEAALATEAEFRDLFPQCEIGAMPPFGNLWGLEVFCAEELAEDEEIAFNAGTHTELIRMSYADFARLVRPRVVSFSAAPVGG